MKRTLILVAVVVGFAAAANAATLSVVSNKTTYTPGETITLTVTGDSEGAASKGIVGRLVYSAAFTETVSSSQTPHTYSFGNSTWTQGALPTGDDFAVVFNQIAGNTARTVEELQIATATLVAQAAGTVDVEFLDDGGTNTMKFFGLTNSPGIDATFTIIPEPTTAVLIGLGLLGLAMGGRRR